MADKDKQMADKLQLIRSILCEDNEDTLAEVTAALGRRGAPGGCAKDKLCAEFEMEMLEVLALINSEPDVFEDPVLEKIAKRTLAFLRGFSAAANVKIATRDR